MEVVNHHDHMTAYQFAALAAIKGHGAQPTTELVERVLWTLDVMVKAGYKLEAAAHAAAETHLLAY